MNDRELEQALADFRGAVRRWSAASEPKRRFAPNASRWMLRLAAAAVAAALVAVPVYEKVQRDRARAAELAKQDDALLEGIASDLARPAPAAFEPLTQLVIVPASTKETK